MRVLPFCLGCRSIQIAEYRDMESECHSERSQKSLRFGGHSGDRDASTANEFASRSRSSLSMTTLGRRLTWRGQHIVVVVHDGAPGFRLQSLERNLLLDSSVSRQASPAKEKYVPVSHLKVDGHQHTEVLVHSGLRHFHVEDNVSIRADVE